MATRGRAAARGRGHGGSWQQRCRATAARGRGSARSSCPVLDGGASMQRRRTEQRLVAVGLDDDAWSSDARRGSVWSCGSGPQARRQRGSGRHMHVVLSIFTAAGTPRRVKQQWRPGAAVPWSNFFDL
ncbi:hypothetical protein PVAP13_9KG295800 [Panicum virgatum]|uniref:Uncharacterized protein n=1 Tax=Panicum virgatum TaxID=38727 RepID=A0A8T0NNR2_PANVG|nr:hypothetical protein PVAP13_9KG295800 [Panicum virgatum]